MHNGDDGRFDRSFMTRRHYEFIADVVKSIEIDPSADADHVLVVKALQQVIALKFARALTSTNPSFDPATFLKACGVNSTMATAFSQAHWLNKEMKP